ncbi:MAG TPA: FMN-binding negative transcriptional regulator [Caulobacteraceae bacterium]
MHPARAFHETDREAIAALVAARGLAVICGVAGGRPLIAHAPVLLASAHLRFHLSAANPLAAALTEAPWALAVVSGDDAYISPDWYAATDQVPTWNYLSAEIEGPVRVLGAREATALLDDLSARHEAGLAPKPPWTRAKMTPARFEALLAGIVAYEMTIERLAGVSKLSQNKPAEEIARLAAALAERPDDPARRLAAKMLNRAAADRPGS